MERLNRSRGICWRFLNGNCTFGDTCRYRHERPSQICRHFQKDGCWFGDNCKFLHVLPPGGRLQEPRVPLVPFHFSVALGQTDRGVSMSTAGVFQHQSSEQNPTLNEITSQMAIETPRVHPQADIQLPSSVLGEKVERHLQVNVKNEESEGATAAPQSAERAQAINYSKNVTCGICMDIIFEKPILGHHKFGILPNCTHSFCLDCIRKWRKTRDISPVVVKSCPICRVKSGFFVPHNYWVEGQEKEALIDAFKKKFSNKTCDFFLRHGRCHFKSDCLYRHDKTLRSSSPEIPEDAHALTSDMLFYLIAMALIDSKDDDGDDEGFNLLNALSSLGFF